VRVLAVVIFLSTCHKSVSAEMAKCRIRQTMPHDSQWTLDFRFRNSWKNSNAVTPMEAPNTGGGRLNAGAVAVNWGLSRQNTVNFVWSQFYHTERPPYFVCSMFAVTQCSASREFVSDTWSLFYRSDALSDIQPTVSKHWRQHTLPIHSVKIQKKSV